MKKLLCAAVVGAFLSSGVQAQDAGDDLKPFKVDVSLGYAVPGGKGAKGGVLFVVEPKYAVIPNLAVGVRMEAAVMARAAGYDAQGDLLDVEVKAAGSYLATADYYFTNNYSLRPFVGGGLGLFRIASAAVKSDDQGEMAAVAGGNKLGGMIRAGLEARHFRFGLEYNLAGSSNFEGYDANGEPTIIKGKNSYFGVKMGICIGGGRR